MSPIRVRSRTNGRGWGMSKMGDRSARRASLRVAAKRSLRKGIGHARSRTSRRGGVVGVAWGFVYIYWTKRAGGASAGGGAAGRSSGGGRDGAGDVGVAGRE